MLTDTEQTESGDPSQAIDFVILFCYGITLLRKDSYYSYILNEKADVPLERFQSSYVYGAC